MYINIYLKPHIEKAYLKILRMNNKMYSSKITRLTFF